jgi:hypothetical protein
LTSTKNHHKDKYKKVRVFNLFKAVSFMIEIKSFGKIFCILVLILMTLSMLDVLYLAGATKRNTTFDLPFDIHLNWQHDTSTTMTVVWETTTSTSGSTVKYGPDTNYSQIVTGTTDNQGTNGLIHIVEITGLSPGLTYHYTCGDITGGWSPDSIFMTAPANTTNFTFISMGDSRDNPTEFQKIVGKVIIVNPDFVGFSGDLCGSDNANDYDVWFTIWQLLGNHISIVPSIGNHEEGGVNYIHRFTLPNNERWYSLNYSNMHIIVLSTSQDTYAPGTEQYNWLVNDLQAAANDSVHTWKIAIFHNPPYNVGGHGCNPNVQNYLVPIFNEYKVDLVFNGHNHYYERTYPLKGGGATPIVTDTNLHYYKNPDGIIYATTGSCGAPLYDIGSAYYLAVAVKNYNYAKISIYLNNSLHMETFLDDGATIIDDFWIEKNISSNLPPNTPTINGQTNGKINVEYTYTSNTTDPDGDQVYYWFDWGDKTNSGWIGPYISGVTASAKKTWNGQGTYEVKVVAKDTHSQLSAWSDLLDVTMPKARSITTPFLDFLAKLPNMLPILRHLMRL